jgi:hypothetical protein
LGFFNTAPNNFPKISPKAIKIILFPKIHTCCAGLIYICIIAIRENRPGLLPETGLRMARTTSLEEFDY